jgi:hypothetical protein
MAETRPATDEELLAFRTFVRDNKPLPVSFARVALARLDAAEAALREREWRPIETAPKDGEPGLLLCDGQYVATGCWNSQNERWEDDSGVGFRPKPTHWQPLPAAPKEA